MTFTTDCEIRDQLIDSLRNVASYLASHPDVPVPEYGVDITIYASPAEDGGCYQVDRIARSLKAPVTDSTATGGDYMAERDFGAIHYRVVCSQTNSL